MTEFATGSLGVSKKSHSLLKSLVYDGQNPEDEKPFSSIVEGFRFAFALGFRTKNKIEGAQKTETISPRQFIVSEYKYLLIDELIDSGKSLGGLISEYAEGGCELILNQLAENKYLSSLIN